MYIHIRIHMYVFISVKKDVEEAGADLGSLGYEEGS